MKLDGFEALSLITLLILSFAGLASADVQALCSSQNTGADSTDNTNHYQSNGACSKTCAGYAFGVVQGQSCWCTNVAPSDTVDVSNCSDKCPGYPFEFCGNEASNLFGYVALGKTPEGTADSNTSPSSPSPTPTPTIPPDTNTVTQVVTAISVSVDSSPPQVSVSVASVAITPEPATPTTPTPTSAAPPTTSTSISTSISTSTWTPTPSPSILTVGGSIKTIVVTPSRPPQATTTVAVAAADNAADHSGNSFFNNKGAVAGVFTVVGLLILAIIGGALFFFFRRRRGDQEGSERLNSMEEDRNSVVPSTFMSRRTSELGLRTDVPPRIGTGDDKTPSSTNFGMGTPGTMSRRASMPLTDQRLNPANLFHDNGSHLSVASLQDNQDYSRPVLQIANPDRPGSSAIEDD